MLEILMVISIIALLLGSGFVLMGGNSAAARRSGADSFIAMAEQARARSTSTRSHVALGIAEPGDLSADDQLCRIGLLRIESWPDDPGEPIRAELINRWRPINSGIILMNGSSSGGLPNPLDEDELAIVHGPANQTINIHALVFNPMGVITYPPGSHPIGIRVAEGCYRNGETIPHRRGTPPSIQETILKIGRLNSRAYRIDP